MLSYTFSAKENHLSLFPGKYNYQQLFTHVTLVTS